MYIDYKTNQNMGGCCCRYKNSSKYEDYVIFFNPQHLSQQNRAIMNDIKNYNWASLCVTQSQAVRYAENIFANITYKKNPGKYVKNWKQQCRHKQTFATLNSEMIKIFDRNIY